jgi:hypothetical protein
VWSCRDVWRPGLFARITRYSDLVGKICLAGQEERLGGEASMEAMKVVTLVVAREHCDVRMDRPADGERRHDGPGEGRHASPGIPTWSGKSVSLGRKNGSAGKLRWKRDHFHPLVVAREHCG